MCIMLKEMGILNDVTLIATDLDLNILEKAKSGVYPIKNMELNEKNYIRFQGTGHLKDYYREENGNAVFHKELLMNVSWRRHDLVLGDEDELEGDEEEYEVELDDADPDEDDIDEDDLVIDTEDDDVEEDDL